MNIRIRWSLLLALSAAGIATASASTVGAANCPSNDDSDDTNVINSANAGGGGVNPGEAASFNTFVINGFGSQTLLAGTGWSQFGTGFDSTKPTTKMAVAFMLVSLGHWDSWVG